MNMKSIIEDKICDQVDCPMHPDSWGTTSNVLYFSMGIEDGKSIKIAFPCLLCAHRKEIDMKKY